MATNTQARRYAERIKQLETRIKQLEIEHDDWRTKARRTLRAIRCAEKAEAALAEAQTEIERLKKVVALQAAALDVWKKANPSADGGRLAVHRILHADLATERERTKRLVDALAQSSYASGLLARALRGWARPATGMGSNILIEDKGRWQMALRELEKVDPTIQAALLDAGEKPRCSTFEPCRKGDEGDDPAHNFTCSLLCVTCGLPREMHSAGVKP